MDWNEALQAVTLAPAEVLGVEETHGTLEAGKAANVVVWSGDPFELTTSAERVLIRGQEVEDDSRQKRLMQRYKRMNSGQPVQYDDGGSQ